MKIKKTAVRLLAGFLAVGILCFSEGSVTGIQRVEAEEETSYIMGDANLDGRVSAEDALEILKYVAHINELGSEAKLVANVTKTEDVDATDALMVLKYVANMISGLERRDNFVKPEREETVYAAVISVAADNETVAGASYTTITEAFAYVNENPPASEEKRICIRIEPGTYREFVKLTAPYITLEGNGEKPEDVILTYYYGCGRTYKSLNNYIGGSETASINISSSAHDFTGKNLTFENSHNLYVCEEEKDDYVALTAKQKKEDGRYDKTAKSDPTLEDRIACPDKRTYVTQGLAMRTEADRSAFYECRFIGRQDTLLINNYARFYFEECFIEGTVDFIYGSGVAVFESCQVNVPDHTGTLTAASHEKEAPYGYLFNNCDFTREASEYSTANPVPVNGESKLGRPWNGKPQIIYWNCNMDSHIATGEGRYVEMSGNLPENCRLLEGNTRDIQGYKISLNGILPSYMHEITEAEMSGYYSAYNHLIAKYDSAKKALEEPDYWNPGMYETTEKGSPLDIFN